MGEVMRIPLSACLLLLSVAACGGSGTDGGPPFGNGRPPAPPDWALQGQSFSWQAYKFLIPPSMTLSADGSKGFVQLDGQGCQIFFLPPQASKTDKDQQALDLLGQIFNDPNRWGSLYGLNAPSPLDDNNHHRGVSGEGWTYVELRTGFRKPGGVGFTDDMARIMLADLGNGTSGVMVGYQTDSNVRCINEGLNPYEWVLLTTSLSLPTASPTNKAALHDALLGGWFAGQVGSSISTALNNVYGANGRYDSTATVQTYQALNPQQYLEKTSSWRGNGAWSQVNNLLQRVPDDAGLKATSPYIRLFQERNTAEPTGWRWYLYELSSCGSSPCEAAFYRG